MIRSEVARQAQVNIETLRHYERKGLLPEPPRTSSGYRQYSQDDIHRIKFIKRAQKLGFTLREITELLALRVDPDVTCEEVRHQAEAKICDIEGKIRGLQKMHEVLTDLVATCDGRGSSSSCPILEALDNDVQC